VSPPGGRHSGRSAPAPPSDATANMTMMMTSTESMTLLNARYWKQESLYTAHKNKYKTNGR